MELEARLAPKSRAQAFAEAFRRALADDVIFGAWATGAPEPRAARSVRYNAWTAARAARRLYEATR